MEAFKDKLSNMDDKTKKLLIGGVVVGTLVAGGSYLWARSKDQEVVSYQDQDHRPATAPSSLAPSSTTTTTTTTTTLVEEKAGPKELRDPFTKGEHVKMMYEDAEFRFNALGNVAYKLMVAIPKGKMFYGYQTVEFDLGDMKGFDKKRSTGVTGLHLDLQADLIHSVVVNGVDVSEGVTFQHRRIELPTSSLQANARNTVTVLYERVYGNEGTGLHSMTDSKDGEQYLFSQFESPYCHQFMPCFDQPSLKAVLDLTVLAPTDWKVMANQPTKDKQLISTPTPAINALLLDAFGVGGRGVNTAVLHVFEPTPRISTYLYAICAGNYFERTCQNPSAVCPMKLYCRQTYKHLLTKEYAETWFDVSDFGLRFHGEFMGIEYPYMKLDQVFCPEYNWGAMENVGCITYTESYLPKVTPTRGKVVGVHNTILHELAHQWFGNLITMHWWEDLWLNESFATFMATLAQMSYKDEGDDANIDFLNETIWGMTTDQRTTTHPIASPSESVSDTEVAERNFDGISYGKGGSWLKQLYKFVSPPVFKDGIQRYFKKYCGGNTKLVDFVGCFSDAVNADAERKGIEPVDLQAWAASWLQNCGVMTLAADVDVEDGKITSFLVKQGFAPCAEHVYKQHKMDIIVYDKDMKSVTKEVTVRAQETTDLTAELEGLPCAAVLLNANCFSYVKVTLKQEWVDFLVNNFDKIKDPLDKFYLCFIMIDMIRDGRQNPVVFLKFFADKIVHEKQAVLFQNAVGDTQLVAKKYIAPQHKDQCIDQLMVVLLKCLDEGPEPDKKTIVISSILALCTTKNNIQRAVKWLQEGNVQGYHELELDQARALLVQVCSQRNVSETLKVELEQRYIGEDKSSDAEAFRTKCLVARPDKANKDKHWEFLLNCPEGVSQEEYQHVCNAFTLGMTKEEVKCYSDGYFSFLPTLFKEKSQFYGTAFARMCFPMEVDPCPEYLAKLEEALEKNRALGEKEKDIFLDTAGVTLADRAKRYLAGHANTDMSAWNF